FSYAAQVENQDYALYTINLSGTGLQLFYDIPNKIELNSDVLLSKPVPPIIPDGVTAISDELPPTINPSTYFKNGSFRFDCVNMFTNAEVDEPMTDAPPITKNAKINFFLNFQRQDTNGLDTSIFLYQKPIDFNGAIHVEEAPADVPMFEQVVDTNGKVISGTKNQIAHVTGMNYGRFGTGTKCVGCHAGHTTIPVPPNIFLGQYFNTSTSASVTQSSFRYINDSLQFPGKRVVDRKARNDTLTVNWIAAGSQNEFVNLRWDLPIDVKSVVIYNIRPNQSNGTNIQVNDCEIFLYYRNVQVAHIPSTGLISVNGTKINIPLEPKTDEVKVIVKSFTGQITGQNVAGLAEVETISKISFYEIIGIKKISEIASKFSLSQNYPNPFNPVTKIKFTIPSLEGARGISVKLIIYDILGKEIKTLVNDILKPGTYEAEFNGGNFASGIYYYRLTAGDGAFSATKKMVLLK
ncbi:MAG: T9SS type A sorting domain-containing protein, partial [Ignavibacteria bacterium]